VSIIERAFELAKAGSCANVNEIRAQLKRERYTSVDEHLAGPSLGRQLRKLCLAAQNATTPVASSEGGQGVAS